MTTKAEFEIVEDDKVWRQLKARLAEAAGSYAKAGVVGSKAAEPSAESEFSVVDLAVVHEFGTTIQHPGTDNGFGRGVKIPPHAIEIPERSFIRSAFDIMRSEYEDRMRDFAGWIYDGKVTAKRALDFMGQLVAKDIRQQIRSDIPPPLAGSTTRRKLKKTRPGSEGSPVALIDTGQMLNSVTFEVVVTGAPVGEPEKGK